MNDHQLLCFLTVSRTLNFTTAARELYCTQPALSYQIRSLEKELDLALFERSTTRVALTEAGRAFVPQAEGIYRSILNARTALKGFARRRTLTLRLPPVLLQRDPIYPILMARLHAALPGYEFAVDTRPVSRNPHEMLCSEADAALYLPFGPLQPEIERTPILHNTFYLIVSPEHPLTGRSTLALTEAGRAFVPQAEGIYRSILNARTALKGFARRRTLTLRLPPVLLQRDPIYPILMARLHAALPGYEFAVDTRPVSRNPHEMLCSEADAALYLPFGPLQPEIERTPILHNTFYLIVSPEHPLTGRSTLALADLAGQQLFYEPLYQEMVDLAVVQSGLPFSAPSWHMVENYECVYNDLLAGRGMFLCPMKYPAFPAAWYLPLQLPLPDTCLLTLRDDPRPEIQRLREVFTAVYASRAKLLGEE